MDLKHLAESSPEPVLIARNKAIWLKNRLTKINNLILSVIETSKTNISDFEKENKKSVDGGGSVLYSKETLDLFSEFTGEGERIKGLIAKK